MAYPVLARKYRPQTFGEMSGQEHVVRTLSNALKSCQLAHAFLFTCPRGVGKTTSARLVAKCLNCLQGPTAAPCGVCAPCVEIAEGRAVDVVEIDAASNNGVDNVRDIVEAVKYRPARDRFKIFIVDEVPMLSTGAFNALLKTLEEPPEHVKCVLATSDGHKVPETIVSRCQRFDFRRLTQQQIVAQLRKVADAEQLAVSDAALAQVARAAEGGMRDALSMLDQVRAACGDVADDASVAEAVGAVDAGAVSRLGAALLARDGAVVLAEVGALHARGQEMKRVAEELVRHLRNVVVAKLVPQAPLDLTDVERNEVLAQAGGAPAPQLTRLFDLVQKSVAEVKESEQPRYAFEVALLKGCFLAPGAEVQELIARLEGMGPGSGGGSSPSPRAATPTPTATATAKPTATTNPSPRPSPLAGEREMAPRAGVKGPPSADDPSASTPDRWRAAVREIERASPALANALKQAVLIGMAEGEIAVRMTPGMPLSTVERRAAEIEGLFARHFGHPVRLALTKGAPASASEPGAAAPAAPAPPQSLAAAEQAERDARSARVKANARSNPQIQEAAQILDGEVTKVEEL